MRCYKKLLLQCALGMLLAVMCTDMNAVADDKKQPAPPPPPKKTPDSEITPANDPVMVIGSFLKPPQPGRFGGSRGLGSQALPQEFQDAAFDRYVDMQALGDAWDQLDASLLTDVALQLAEGERILLRTHKSGLTASRVLRQAARVAAHSNDRNLVERVLKAGNVIGDAGLKSELANFQKLAGVSRAADPAFSVDIASVNPYEFALYHQVYREVQAARIRNDLQTIEQLETFWKGLDGLPKEKRDYLLKIMGEARSQISPDAKDPHLATISTLDRLAGESRTTREDIDRERARKEAEEKRMAELRRAGENAAVHGARQLYNLWNESPVRPNYNEGRAVIEFRYSKPL